ncbi:hypothetical protein DKX38_008420 [Salix brachista]|uniref:Auxin-responsive protein n=1 Tax=Salix brachista TaxID=2182728 RepID=A0A5N5MT45_9ROSI|nr:hypothetical protein DKX38_008420 [Salix brachista]
MEVEKGTKMGFEETELRLGLPGNGGGGTEGGESARKRGFSETVDLKLNLSSKEGGVDPNHEKTQTENNLLATDPAKPPAKFEMKVYFTHHDMYIHIYIYIRAQVVGWPPVRSFRKNMLAVQKSSTDQRSTEKVPGGNATCVKVSMVGAPYLRKVDLKNYNSYHELSDALGKMLSSFTIGNCGGSHGTKDFLNESRLVDLLNGTDYVPTYEDKDGDWMLVGDVPWDTKSHGEMQEQKFQVVSTTACSFDLVARMLKALRNSQGAGTGVSEGDVPIWEVIVGREQEHVHADGAFIHACPFV